MNKIAFLTGYLEKSAARGDQLFDLLKKVGPLTEKDPFLNSTRAADFLRRIRWWRVSFRRAES